MVKDSNEGNRKAGQGANEAYMDRLGRMAADDPEPDDAGRAVVDGFLSRLSERTGREGPFAVGEPSVYAHARSRGERVAGPIGRETPDRLGLDDALLEANGVDRADFESDVADALADMVAEDIEDNLAGIADEVASDRYGVGLEDLR